MKPNFKRALFDILTGILSAGIMFVVLGLFPFSICLIVIAPVPVIAGFIRGKEAGHLLSKILLMNLLHLLLLLVALVGALHYLLVPLVGMLGTSLGIHLRMQQGPLKVKVLTPAMLYCAGVLYLAFAGVPAYFEATLWKEMNAPAPDYKFVSRQKDTIRRADHAGKVLVLDFWATWCGPCQKLFPEMEKVYKAFKDDSSVVFLSVNPDRRDTPEKIMKFIRENNYDVPWATDVHGFSAKSFGIRGYPRVLILDRRGIIRQQHFGFDESERFYARMCAEIKSLL